MDPLAEKYYSITPYAYCHNNPVNRIDPDGKNDKNGIKTEPNKIYGVSISAQSTTGGNEPRVIRSTPIKQSTPIQQAVKTTQSQPRGEIKDANQVKFHEMHNEAMNDPVAKQCLTDPVLQSSAGVILAGGPEAVVSTATKVGQFALENPKVTEAVGTVGGFSAGILYSKISGDAQDAPQLNTGWAPLDNGVTAGQFVMTSVEFFQNINSSNENPQKPDDKKKN